MRFIPEIFLDGISWRGLLLLVFELTSSALTRFPEMSRLTYDDQRVNFILSMAMPYTVPIVIDPVSWSDLSNDTRWKNATKRHRPMTRKPRSIFYEDQRVNFFFKMSFVHKQPIDVLKTEDIFNRIFNF